MPEDFSPEISNKIDRQMTGLMFAMVELAVAAHPKMEGDRSRFNYDRIVRLLNAMPRHCPYPCALVPALVKQFDHDRFTTLQDVYDNTYLRPNDPLHMKGIDDELVAEIFIGLAAQDPAYDNEIFEEERAEAKDFDDLL